MNVAIVSCDKWVDVAKDDLILSSELYKLNVSVEIISWKKNINWSSFNVVVIRSTWDYYENIDEFCRWLDRLNTYGIKIVNGYETIKYTLSKKVYLEYLKFNKINIIPTLFIEKRLFNNEFKYGNSIKKYYMLHKNKGIVIKPSISASSSNVFKLNTFKDIETFEFEKYFNDLRINENAHNDYILIQPFIKEFEDGEISLVFFKNEIKYCFRRFSKKFFTDKTNEKYIDVPENVKELAYKALTLEKFKNLDYVRIDVIMFKNSPVINEIEVIEPDLMFRHLDVTDYNYVSDFAKIIVST